jgi:hypothetical protein
MAKLKLVLTCGACPEQYDGYIDGEKVAYFRLRHGTFRAEYRGHTVFSGCPDGDGIFDSDERNYWLEKASQAILAEHEKFSTEVENLSFEIENPEEIDDWSKY